MKIKKVLAALCVCACLVPAAAFAACGGDNGDGDGVSGDGVYTFEAEGVDLSEQSGRGWSNEAQGCGMIQGQNTYSVRENASVLKSISNGYFVGFFSTEGTVLEFNIHADAADTQATLALRLASEWGTMEVDDSVMTIEVNGTKIAYDAFTVTGKKIDGATEIEYGVPFKDFAVSSKISLNQGENTVKLIASGKAYPQTPSLCMGPGVDCIKIKSTAKLTWESLWDENKDNIKVE